MHSENFFRFHDLNGWSEPVALEGRAIASSLSVAESLALADDLGVDTVCIYRCDDAHSLASPPRRVSVRFGADGEGALTPCPPNKSPSPASASAGVPLPCRAGKPPRPCC
jgi:hypothetical protein